MHPDNWVDMEDLGSTTRILSDQDDEYNGQPLQLRNAQGNRISSRHTIEAEFSWPHYRIYSVPQTTKYKASSGGHQ